MYLSCTVHELFSVSSSHPASTLAHGAFTLEHEGETRAERHAVGMGGDLRGVAAPAPRIGTCFPGNMVVCVEKASTSMRDGAGA